MKSKFFFAAALLALSMGTALAVEDQKAAVPATPGYTYKAPKADTNAEATPAPRGTMPAQKLARNVRPIPSNANMAIDQTPNSLPKGFADPVKR